MTWVLIGVGAWVALAVVAALVIGRSIGLADRQSVGSPRTFILDDVPAAMPLPRTPPPGEHAAQPSTKQEEPEDPSTIPGIPSARPNVLPPVPPSSNRPKDVRRQSEAG
jgi:hypothetical protein